MKGFMKPCWGIIGAGFMPEETSKPWGGLAVVLGCLGMLLGVSMGKDVPVGVKGVEMERG